MKRTLAGGAVPDITLAVGARKNPAHDPDGVGWYSWVMLANASENSPPRIIKPRRFDWPA